MRVAKSVGILIFQEKIYKNGEESFLSSFWLIYGECPYPMQQDEWKKIMLESSYDEVAEGMFGDARTDIPDF